MSVPLPRGSVPLGRSGSAEVVLLPTFGKGSIDVLVESLEFALLIHYFQLFHSASISFR